MAQHSTTMIILQRLLIVGLVLTFYNSTIVQCLIVSDAPIPPVVIVRPSPAPSFASTITPYLFSSLAPQTQAQQMSDAAKLKTLQGTKWRVNIVSSDNSFPCQQQTLVFQGFSEQPNKGILKCTCGDYTTTGRWLTKPSEIRKGAVELSARWKIKLSTTAIDATQSSFIFKGFIRADPTLSLNGSTVSAEMKGTILESISEKTIGKFQADLLDTNVGDEELRMGVE